MAVTIGYAVRPLAGEKVSGDQCEWWNTGTHIVAALADGLGHGEQAAYAAKAALTCIGENLERPCETIFSKCDAQLRDTRGVALALAIIELDSGRMTLGAVGNIRAMLLRNSRDIRFGGARGIVGGGFSSFTPETVLLTRGEVLLLFSDGLDEFIPLREIFSEPPTTSVHDKAQRILDSWARANDDASVLIYRHEEFKST
ncbi:MAG TPA: SpoIIE family protein phosphatase [Desulfuromonadales bacterium]|nr:SpoIIE family protein phosphatase [Desulfuromonadales bacterium]